MRCGSNGLTSMAAMETEPTPPPLRPARIPPVTIHILRFLVLIITVGFGLHLLLPQIAGLEKSVDSVRALPPALVALAALMQVGNYGGTGLMMYSLAALVGSRLSVIRGTIISVAGASVGLVAGGTVGNSAVTYRWVRGSGTRRLGAALCATIPLLLIHLMLLLVSVIGLVSLFFIGELTAVVAAARHRAEGEDKPEDKTILLNMALAWVRLAQQSQQAASLAAKRTTPPAAA